MTHWFPIGLFVGFGIFCQSCVSSPKHTQQPEARLSEPIETQAQPETLQPLPKKLSPSDAPRLNAAFLDSIQRSNSAISAQGFWAQSTDQAFGAHQEEIPLSAASVTKIATSLAAIDRLGPQYRFMTQFGFSGNLSDGVIQGDLIIAGGDDPFFVWEDAFAIANKLNALGIQQVTGDLVIQAPFVMNFEADPITSGQLFQQALNSNLWTSEAIAQYNTLPAGTPKPNLPILGSIRMGDPALENTQWLVQHQSLPLVELLKRMNRYSNNPMADQIANHLGGGNTITEIVRSLTGLNASEVNFINGSGLGPDNKITPQGATLMMQALSDRMQSHGMTLGDVMTIVGKDSGILDPRPLPEGLVVKSGTLNQVSALAGVLPTETEGLIWFSIFNTQGDVASFRSQQEALLQEIVTAWGIRTEESSLRPTLDPAQLKTITQPL